jgi:calcineurin-like phosphoesterase family protein
MLDYSAGIHKAIISEDTLYIRGINVVPHSFSGRNNEHVKLALAGDGTLIVGNHDSLIDSIPRGYTHRFKRFQGSDDTFYAFQIDLETMQLVEAD